MKLVLHYFKQLCSVSGGKLYFNLLGLVLVSLMEGIGILLLIPLLSISGIININIGVNSFLRHFLFLQYIPKASGLLVILGIFLFLVVVQNLVQRFVMIQNAKIHQGFVEYLRLKISISLFQANWMFYIKKRKSDIINSLTSELGKVSGGVHVFLQLLTSIVFTIIQIGFALWLSAKITLFVISVGLILIFFSRKVYKKAKNLGKSGLEITQIYLAGITDQFNGIKDIKSNRLEHSRLIWLKTIIQKMLQEHNKLLKMKFSSQMLYKISSAVILSFFLYVSIMIFNTQPEQLLLIIVIFSRLWPMITGMQSTLEQLSSTIPAFQSLTLLLDECKHDTEMEENKLYETVNPIRIERGIECRNIYFRYEQGNPEYVLEKVNLRIPANRTTAIVGRSGAGKSTLIDILMGLIRADKGEVYLDDIPLSSNNLLSLRQSISYVSQDPFLFNSSIRENLLMIEPQASKKQIWEALELSASADFVKKLPQGLNTLIGDRGVRLSGGERQRLVLARALLRKPSILVLDEATSALDTENEAKIQMALDQLKGRMTIIVIAHRLSTIRNADQVIVLDQGRVVQQGEYGKLANEKGGLFSKLLGMRMEAEVIG